MQPIILNRNFEKQCVVDDYVSFIWTSRYYTTGDFELCIDITSDKAQHIVKDYYIMREDDDNVGIIENIQIDMNEDGQEIVIVSGRFLSSILGRRIIDSQTQLNTTVGDALATLVVNAIITPTDTVRKISNMRLGTYNVTDERIKAQYTGDNLLDTVSTVCETYGLGHKITLSGNLFRFNLYKGVDRSYNQTENPYVVFSDEYDNLLSSSYAENKSDLVTTALVAGEGEGLARKTVWVGAEATGLDRYEVYVDKRDLSTNEGEISDTDYFEQLKEAGREHLTSNVMSFTGEVHFDNIVYKQDVFLGDICSIENTKWGIYINSRLVEVIESVDEAGNYSIIPTFAS